MSEKLKILLEIHALLTEQIEAAKKEAALSPEQIAQYDERSKRIRDLVERLGKYYSDSES
jgi:hypothetical protein